MKTNENKIIMQLDQPIKSWCNGDTSAGLHNPIKRQIMKARKQFKTLRVLQKENDSESSRSANITADNPNTWHFFSCCILSFFLPWFCHFVSPIALIITSLMLYLPNYFTGLELIEVTGFHQTFDFKLNVSTLFESCGEIKGRSDEVFASCSWSSN